MLRAMRTVEVRRSSMQRAGPLASSVAGRRRLRETLEGQAFLLPTIFGLGLFRAIYFFPSIISMTAVALMWSFLFNPDLGFINYVIRRVFHVPGPEWVNSIQWAMPALIFVGVWKWAGYNMVIFLAGLQSIDRSLQEAAAMDGANSWQRVRHVTWPGLTPTTLFVLVIMLIGSFQVFEQTYVMT